MPRRKQVYKITYPNGKIYVGMDLTGTLLYMGSPSAHKQIAADLELTPDRFAVTLRKEILWESETATDAEVRAMEIKLIRETRANDPAVGYNLVPRFRQARYRSGERAAAVQGNRGGRGRCPGGPSFR